jgi:thymidylate kinase
MLVAVVGPCGSGKSTLVEGLRAHGFSAREVAQEHSFVPAMWQRFTQPDLLVYLDVSRDVAQTRVPQHFPECWWEEAQDRLAHARAHADLLLNTDSLSTDVILESTLQFLAQWR